MHKGRALQTWILLSYKVPREPASSRVYVWRKLKRLGAMAVQDAVWVLPGTPQTIEHFRWLAAEIVELRGEAILWEAKLPLEEQNDGLAARFEQQVKPMYEKILKALKRKKADLPALSRQYQQTAALDYFQCELGDRVRAALLAARQEVDK